MNIKIKDYFGSIHGTSLKKKQLIRKDYKHILNNVWDVSLILEFSMFDLSNSKKN